ncbi:putative ADP-ribosylation factor GTPase-activating protein AGD11-like [Planoprotostelium fungivorum]|uniref:Putative ADP-ribosylation factor GTPase-activating protein AGD11-like n=1 Tax=Planoprotostelium fungivorum TaxID=1890364 RepID=A0A2P6NXT5_9EUKA|nr:putative ADP-ribosylation factor GTPase-activating protein AGD11-like [Planoprotostelium fungivorum]
MSLSSFAKLSSLLSPKGSRRGSTSSSAASSREQSDDEEYSGPISPKMKAAQQRSASTDTYVLNLLVAGARDLPNRPNSQSKVDPYVSIKLEKEKFKTKTLHKTSQPQWNEKPVIRTEEAVLTLKCYHKELIGKHSLGIIQIPVSQIRAENSTMTKWIPLQPRKEGGSAQGEICITCDFQVVTRETMREGEEKALKKFHERFPSVSYQEKVFGCYSGALHMDGISRFGYVYLSQRHVCYFSLLGTHKRILPIADIIDLERTSCLLLIPEGVLTFKMKDGRKYHFTRLVHAGKMFDVVQTEREIIQGTQEVNGAPTSIVPEEKKEKVIQVQVKLSGAESAVARRIDETKRVHHIVSSLCESFQIREPSCFTLSWERPEKKKERRMKRLELHRQLTSYHIPEGALLHLQRPVRKQMVVPDLPFSTYQQKFQVREGRESELAVEFALHCVEFSLAVNDDATHLINTEIIKEAMQVSDADYEEMMKRVHRNGEGIETLLVELNYRFQNAERHPYYTRANFRNNTEYDRWRKRERTTIIDIERNLITSDPSFFATLHLKVLEAESLIATDLKTSDPFVVIKLGLYEARTKTKSSTLNPIWNENFEIEVVSGEEELVVQVFDRDIFSPDDSLGSITITMEELLKHESTTKWYALAGEGRIKLETRLTHPYAKYIREITGVVETSTPTISSPTLDASSPLVDGEGDNDIEPVEENSFFSSGLINHNRHFFNLCRALSEHIIHLMKKESTTDSTGMGQMKIFKGFLSFLEEYSGRFGVGWLFCQLSKLYFLEDSFLFLLDQIRRHLEQISLRRDKAPVTRFETTLYRSICRKMWIQVADAIRRRVELFPQNKPKKSVESLSKIVYLLCNNAENLAISKIRSFLQDSSRTKFQKFTEEAEKLEEEGEEHIQLLQHNGILPHLQRHKSIVPKASRKSLTVAQFDLLADRTVQEMKEESLFSPSFPEAVHVEETTTKIYLDLIWKEVKLLCAEENSTDSLGVYVKVRRMLKLVKVTDEEKVDKTNELENMFVPFVMTWLKEIAIKLNAWMEGALELDKKSAQIEDGKFHTSSVSDTFEAVRAALDYLCKLKMRDHYFTWNFLVVACVVGKKYTERLTAELRRDLGLSDETEDDITLTPGFIRHHLKCKHKYHSHHHDHQQEITKALAAEPHSITVQQCLYLGNNEVARVQMNDFAEAMETVLRERKIPPSLTGQDDPDNFFGPTMRALKIERERSLQALWERIGPYVRAQILLATQDNDHKRATREKKKSEPVGRPLERLTNYLDEQLTTFIDHTSPELFRIIIRFLWDALLVDVSDMIFPDDEDDDDEEEPDLMTEEECTRMQAVLKRMEDFFYANGAGINRDKIGEGIDRLERMMKLIRLPTREVIDIHLKLKAREAGDVHADENKRIAITSDVPIDGFNMSYTTMVLDSRREDKIAQSFLNETKQKDFHLKQQLFREKYMLTDAELILESWPATHERKMGHLVLTTSYLVFDPLMSNSDSDDDIILLLSEIISAIRKKTLLKIYECLVVKNKLGEEFLFSSWSCKSMLRDIVHYRITMEHPEMTVEEIEEEEHALEDNHWREWVAQPSTNKPTSKNSAK